MLRYSTKNYVLLEPSELEGLELLKLIEKQVENDLLLLGIINNKLIFQKLKGHNDPLYEIKVSKQLIEQSLNLWKKSVTKFDYSDPLYQEFKRKLDSSHFQYEIVIKYNSLHNLIEILKHFNLTGHDTLDHLYKVYEEWSVSVYAKVDLNDKS